MIPRPAAAAALLLAVLLAPLTPAFAGPAENARLAWGGAGVPVGPTLPGERSLDDAAEDLSVEERRAIQDRLKVRRAMVEAHQVLSISTTGLILAAEVFGVVNAVALQQGNPPYRDLKASLAVHRVLVGGALGTYFGSGLLAWTMPRAFRAQVPASSRKKKLDSGDLHVALSVGHGVGMLTMLATGVLMANVADNKAWEPLLVTHAAVGFATAAMVVGAAVVINTL